MTRASILVASLALAFAPRDAAADDPPPCADEAEAVKKMKTRDPALRYPKKTEAVKHLEAGKRAFGVQQYDTAIDEYTAAGLADEAPLILYNLGQTYRAAKDYDKAIRQYTLFLDRGKPGKEVRALVECHVRVMTAEMEHAASTAPPTGPAPDQTGDPEVDQPPLPTSPAEPLAEDDHEESEAPRSRWTTSRRVALATGAAGLVTVAAGVVFGLQSQGYKDDAARLCPSTPCGDADQANALGDKADSRALFANVSYGAGAALIVGAAVLWYVGAPSSSQTDHAVVVPQINPTFAGLAVSGRF